MAINFIKNDLLNSMKIVDEMSERSKLVSDFFDHMNRQNISWVVMNNYDGLPEVIPSDIDFSIPNELFYRLDSFICDFSERSGARLVQKLWHGNMKCAYILATGYQSTSEFVQLDFFTTFSTKGAPALIAHDDLVAGRRALKNFHVPRPEIELIFIAMRRFFKNDWSDRHCARVAELSDQIHSTNWLPETYQWMRPTLEAAIRGDVEMVVARRGNDWEQLKKTARNNLNLIQIVGNAVLQAKRFASRLRDETGQLIILASPISSVSDQLLNKLEMVFHRRLFIESPAGVGLLAKLALLKRRKGLIFILAGSEHPRGNFLARCAARIGLVDHILYSQSNLGSDLQALGLPATEFTSDAVMIETVLKFQTAKTAKAIARGGSQTSGAAK